MEQKQIEEKIRTHPTRGTRYPVPSTWRAAEEVSSEGCPAEGWHRRGPEGGRDPKAGSPNPEKVGGKKGGPRSWVPEGCGPRRVDDQNFAFFFSLSAPNFVFYSIWGLLVELWPRFKAIAYPKCALGLLWGIGGAPANSTTQKTRW